MGKMIYFIGILIFIDIMFFMFVNSPSYSVNGVIFRTILISSGGNIDSNQTGNWTTIKDQFFCDADNVNEIYSGDGGCNSKTLLGVLIAGLIAALALGVVTFFSSASISVTELAWTAVGVFFFFQLGADFVGIYNYLANIHPPFTKVFAMVLMVPFIILFAFVIIEWINKKD